MSCSTALGAAADAPGCLETKNCQAASARARFVPAWPCRAGAGAVHSRCIHQAVEKQSMVQPPPPWTPNYCTHIVPQTASQLRGVVPSPTCQGGVRKLTWLAPLPPPLPPQHATLNPASSAPPICAGSPPLHAPGTPAAAPPPAACSHKATDMEWAHGE